MPTHRPLSSSYRPLSSSFLGIIYLYRILSNKPEKGTIGAYAQSRLRTPGENEKYAGLSGHSKQPTESYKTSKPGKP